MNTRPTKPSIWSRVSHRLFSQLFQRELAELESYVDLYRNAYQMGRALLPEEKVEAQVAEQNSAIVNRIIRDRRALGNTLDLTDYDRKLAIDWSWKMFDENTSLDLAADLWTDFGMGQRVSVTATPKKLDAVLQEYWKAPRNRSVLNVRSQAEIARQALAEGELGFIHWYSTLTGLVTTRLISTRDLQIIYDEDDSQLPLWYVVTMENNHKLFIPDWAASPAELNRVELPPNAIRLDQNPTPDSPYTRAVFQHAKRRINRKLNRGMPQFQTAIEWAIVLQNFLGDRAAVAKKAAMFTEKVTVKSGSRFLQQMASQLRSGLGYSDAGYDSNPPAVAGSDWLQNENVNREWMTRDTSAAGARFDGRMFAGMVAAGTRAPLHWMGFSDALANRSTAEETRIPWTEQIKRFRIWLSSVFEEMAYIVLMLNTRVNNPSNEIEFSVDEDVFRRLRKVDINVILDTPIDVPLQEVVNFYTQVATQLHNQTIPPALGYFLLLEIFQIIFVKLGADEPLQQIVAYKAEVESYLEEVGFERPERPAPSTVDPVTPTPPVDDEEEDEKDNEDINEIFLEVLSAIEDGIPPKRALESLREAFLGSLRAA